MTAMRAKMTVESVLRYSGQEVVKMRAVSKKSGYTGDGLDEDNTFARYSPAGELSLTIANPALIGKFNPGDTFYLDFTPAPA